MEMFEVRVGEVRFSRPAPLPPASCVCKVIGSVRE